MKQCVWTILDNKELRELNGGDVNRGVSLTNWLINKFLIWK